MEGERGRFASGPYVRSGCAYLGFPHLWHQTVMCTVSTWACLYIAPWDLGDNGSQSKPETQAFCAFCAMRNELSKFMYTECNLPGRIHGRTMDYPTCHGNGCCLRIACWLDKAKSGEERSTTEWVWERKGDLGGCDERVWAHGRKQVPRGC